MLHKATMDCTAAHTVTDSLAVMASEDLYNTQNYWVLDFVLRSVFSKAQNNTTFRIIHLFPSLGEWNVHIRLGSLERAKSNLVIESPNKFRTVQVFGFVTSSVSSRTQ
jgi:hypothetical protein